MKNIIKSHAAISQQTRAKRTEDDIAQWESEGGHLAEKRTAPLFPHTKQWSVRLTQATCSKLDLIKLLVKKAMSSL